MDRFKSTKIASMLGIIGNLFLLIIKGIVASLSGSQAMVADAFNSAGDIFSSLMTYVGNRISCKKADDDQHLGHGKAEYIYSMLISISMLLMATFVLKDSIKSLFYGSKYTFSIWLIVVCIVTIIVKFSLFLYTNTLYKKHNNLLILANSKDHLNDTIITSLNLISCVLSSYNIFFLDGIVGSIISLWIMYTAIKLFIESYNVLMDKSISLETKNKVLDIIKEEKQVKKIIHFNSTPVGYRYQISFTIYVDGNMSTFDSHEIANNLEEKIIDEVEEIYLVVIHVNPM